MLYVEMLNVEVVNSGKGFPTGCARLIYLKLELYTSLINNMKAIILLELKSKQCSELWRCLLFASSYPQFLFTFLCSSVSVEKIFYCYVINSFLVERTG